MKNGNGSNIIEDLTSCVNNLEEAMAGMTVKYICRDLKGYVNNIPNDSIQNDPSVYYIYISMAGMTVKYILCTGITNGR